MEALLSLLFYLGLVAANNRKKDIEEEGGRAYINIKK
jgi:hypothetical protein